MVFLVIAGVLVFVLLRLLSTSLKVVSEYDRAVQFRRATEPWGIEVTTVEIKDVELPDQMRRAMACRLEHSGTAPPPPKSG